MTKTSAAAIAATLLVMSLPAMAGPNSPPAPGSVVMREPSLGQVFGGTVPTPQQLATYRQQQSQTSKDIKKAIEDRLKNR